MRHKNKRKICIVTGGRADYGLLLPLMRQIQSDRSLALQLIATCMHLSPEFGSTYKQIEKDGFKIDKKIDLYLSSDNPLGISKSLGRAVSEIAKAYEAINPDMIVLLGDRFELMGAACAALIFNIPISHIHGGEITRGAFDDAIRHSITKMSHLHFTSAPAYKKRVIQMGEDPLSVFEVGALGMDNIRELKLLKRAELEKELKFKFGKRNLLVTFHPATLEYQASGFQFNNLLGVLDKLKETNILFTRANADTSGRFINRMIDAYVAKHPENTKAFSYLGQLKYLSAMKLADAVVGNSSSGIIEAPSLKVGTINIGDRQQGRIRTKSIIDCKPVKSEIRIAFKRLYSPAFQKNLKTVKSPYGPGTTAQKIKRILKHARLEGIIKKKFNDIKFHLK